MSARLRDAGTVESARFVGAALARVGEAVGLVTGAVVTTVFEAVVR